jgi:hypothetical protein
MTSIMTTELIAAYFYMTRALSSIILDDSILKKNIKGSLIVGVKPISGAQKN